MQVDRQLNQSDGVTRRDRPGADESWDERALLLTLLRYAQDTAAAKVKGLSPELARRAPLPTSPYTSPAGVLNHLRWVEAWWVDARLLGNRLDLTYDTENPDGDFEEGVTLPLDEVITLYQERVERTRAVFAEHDLDALMAKAKPDRPLTARWILLHLIEETARHNGHLDILREMADGSVGS
jgi:uncharacterized damage-inducible protein DinB